MLNPSGETVDSICKNNNNKIKIKKLPIMSTHLFCQRLKRQSSSCASAVCLHLHLQILSESIPTPTATIQAVFS